MKLLPLLAGLLLLLSLTFGMAVPPPAAVPFPNAVKESDVDFASCRIVSGSTQEPVDAEVLKTLLGLSTTPADSSKRPSRSTKEKEEAQYLLVFKQPVAIGTVLGSVGDIKILKPGAPLPPNPANLDDWQPLDAAPNQATPRFIPLPPGSTVRALLFSTPLLRYGPADVHLIATRLTNHTPSATANAQAEYTSSPYLSAPTTYDAGRITRGRGEWISSGKNAGGINSTAPITELAPTWFILSWPDKRQIDGVLLQDNFEQFDLQVFNGPAGINPAAATDEEWKTIRKFKQTLNAGQRWLTFAPAQTRAVRLHITKTAASEEASARLAGFHVFADLGEKPVPTAPLQVREEAPVKIPYDLPKDGLVTLAIDGPDGTRIRNLIANVPQSAGKNTVAWDLKDENGLYVPPGKYHWKAITHPPLELRYEMTAYPNVNTYFPERPAWLTGADGSGGWLADHTPPRAVCAGGESVFIGAPCAESGVALIECDLEGRKQWGHSSFAAWTGCSMLASDGKTLFNTNTAGGFAKAGFDKSTDGIWAVDIKTKDIRTVAMLEPNAERKRGVQGFAARDNKIYLAIHAPDDWFNNAAAAADVDPLNSLPAYGTPRKERAPHEVVFDPRTDFLRLFRLKDTPPGQGGGLGLSYLESTKTPDRQQHILIAFNKPIAIGSLVFPPPPKDEKVQFQISVLKPNAPYPPRPHEKDDWQVIPLTDKSPWAVQALPAGVTTRALRLTFLKGGEGAADDILTEVEDKKGGPSLDKIDSTLSKKSSFEGADAGAWMKRIEGMKLLSRRFENLYSFATVRVNSGKVSPDGTWDAQRAEPLSTAQPAVYAMEWKQPQSFRGLAIKEIDGEITEVDAYTGPASGPVDIESAEGWEKVATYTQPRREYYQPDPFHNSLARYLDGYVDFGREVNTRALRLRVVKQWDSQPHHTAGVRADQGGTTLDLKRCHVYGVAPLRYLGGEAPVDLLTTQRIEVVDASTGKIEKEIPLAGVGAPGGGTPRGNGLAINAKGDLFALANDKLVRVAPSGAAPQVLASDLVQPTTLACDAEGNFFVFDAAKDRKNIRVYSPEGKFLRVIGAPGGYQPGPWDQNRLDGVTALAVDRLGQIWAAAETFWPKRVTLWNHEGKFLKEFLGPTEYGGAGAIDPGDKRRLFYGPMEFELDWKTGKTQLKNLTSLDEAQTGDIPRRVNDRLYLVNTRANDFCNKPCGLVYLHEGNRVRLVAAVGVAGNFKQLLDPKLVKAFGGKVLLDYICAWSDLNGDGQVQPEEVQLWPKAQARMPGVLFDNQLGVQIGPIGFRVKQWLPNGVPVYERTDSPGLWNGATVRLDNGNFYHFEDDSHEKFCAALQPDGKPLWTYRTEGSGVHALTHSKPPYPGQIMSELGLAGHLTPHAGDLGECLVFNTNVGTFNIMTADGLFAGVFFGDLRESRTSWSSPDNTRGLRLDNVTPGQEHFNGYVCRTEDNRYYVVAGHNHASVVEITGMDRFKRFSGDITIGASEVNTTQTWERETATQKVYARAPVIDCYRLAAPPKLDGKLNDWPGVSAQIDDNVKFRIGYDDENLYLAYEIDQRGPLKNQGKQWDRLFKTGASVDLQIGVDPNAPEDRKAPVAGDLRLLLTFMGDDPAAVLYQSVVPGAPPEKAWQAVSPMGSVSFDCVTRLEKPKFISIGDNDHYVAEAAIPLASLGLKITPELRLKMDWGILTTGPEGTEVLQREYWVNKVTTQITADVPSEAAIHPELWGHIRFHAETPNARPDPSAKKPDKALDDLLNDLK